jgi:hypothetical protein
MLKIMISLRVTDGASKGEASDGTGRQAGVRSAMRRV